MKKVLPALLLALLVGCSSDGKNADDAGTDADTDTDSDTDTDTDTECVPYDTFDPEDCPDVSDITDCVVYVDADAPSGGDGRSWATALPDLQHGLDLATCGVLTTDYCQSWQVWAAEGSYYAYRFCEENKFWIRSEISLYGGFAGEETSLAERDVEAHVTTLDARDGPDGEHRTWSVAIVGAAEDARVDGVTITGGYSEPDLHWGGGGLGVLMSSAEIANCTFEGNESNNGGALYTEESSIEIFDTVFRGNVASYGGGVAMDSSIALFEGCEFSDNHAALNSGVGGAVYLHTGTAVEFVDSIFNGNTAIDSSGGIGVNESNALLEGCELTGNEAPIGGALCGWYSELVVQSTAFAENTATGADSVGGAIMISGGNGTVSDSTLSGNSAWVGGALLADTCQLELMNTAFEGNTAETQAGGVHGQTGSITVFGCSFEGNTSINGGGAVLVANESVVVSECLFVDNSATEEAGALGLGMNEESSVSHCTFAGNVCDTGGSAIGSSDEQLVIIDSILWDETTPEIILITEETPDPIVTYCDVRGGWAGEGNIDADPLFVDPDGGDYCLQAESPCIGAASDAGDMGYCPYEGK